MGSHPASREAKRRASNKWNEANKDYLLQMHRVKYYENNEARLRKLAHSKQKNYEEGTIRFVRRLFISR